ncbi:uncharacterized protein LOC119673888 [Teleopsis dalmanni]|uniref:uncharacterized protein LOC119673888 n=1 Tax=Teleopsis dalmanni TaxID=139649 RepID=UPI0018CEF3F2|nr:uncharacterized protein LOC119673888 [Teleopsis dalmanni]
MEGNVAMDKVCRTSGDGMEEETTSPKVDPNSKDNNDSTTKLDTSAQLPKQKDNLLEENVHIRKPSVSSTNSSNNLLPGLHSLYRRPETIIRSLAPVIPTGELVQLKPRLITTPVKPQHKKTKPPKFVPYEPYPGAVNPIVPNSNSGHSMPKGYRINRNNLDIGVLVDHMSTMRTQELHADTNNETCNVDATNTTNEELQTLKAELKKVKEERDYFQGQFKFQTQVNSELKNLLVASVGEDLQTRVNLLTEDKLQLARALLDTANNLTTHTEQIEFLAGQSEVWRSKFLASSVMVEELARWKADLTQKNQMLNESTKRLLHCVHQLREIQLEILKNLKFIAKIRYLNIPSTDVISLSSENLNILQQMVLHSGVGIPDTNLSISSASTNPLCDAEKYAVHALEFISQPLMATDEAIRALFGQTQRSFGGTSNSSIHNLEQTPNNVDVCS